MVTPDPALLANLADLELAARLIVEGAQLGAHRSPFTGGGDEFEQMRPYLPGDDIRRLDWSHYGRTNRLFTRMHRDTTEWPVMLVLDASASMAFGGHGPTTKWHYARLLAAALTYLLVRQGDAVGLVVDPQPSSEDLGVTAGRAQLVRVLATLQALEADGTANLAHAVRRAAARSRRRGLLVILSDLLDDEGAWQEAVREVRVMQREVAILHVCSPDERQLRYAGEVEFEDLETGQRLVASAERIRRSYDDQAEAFAARQARFAHRHGITLVDALTTASPDRVLRALAGRRVRVRVGA
jgi:uncharacterized protein (DUF58 family)